MKVTILKSSHLLQRLHKCFDCSGIGLTLRLRSFVEKNSWQILPGEPRAGFATAIGLVSNMFRAVRQPASSEQA